MPTVRFRDTLYTARMARDLLWEREKAIKLDEFVTISQTYAYHVLLVVIYGAVAATREHLAAQLTAMRIQRYLFSYASYAVMGLTVFSRIFPSHDRSYLIRTMASPSAKSLRYKLPLIPNICQTHGTWRFSSDGSQRIALSPILIYYV